MTVGMYGWRRVSDHPGSLVGHLPPPILGTLVVYTPVMANDKQQLVELALGRIFRMGARPTQPGDVEEYERCRAIILDAHEGALPADNSPNYARDRNRGAQGD